MDYSRIRAACSNADLKRYTGSSSNIAHSRSYSSADSMLRPTGTHRSTRNNMGAGLGARDTAQGTLFAQHPAPNTLRSRFFGRNQAILTPQACVTISATAKTARASPPLEPGTEAPAITFQDLQQLTGVFPFTDLPTATEQSKPSWLLSKLEACLQAQSTQRTVQLISDPGPGLFVEWLPDFGCALLPLAPAPAKAARSAAAVLQPGHVALYLLGPDGWMFDMHSMPDKQQHTSSFTRAASLYCGHVPAKQYQGLVAAMHAAIQAQKALKMKDKKKGVHGAKSCYQRTPSFILSAVQAALVQRVNTPCDSSAAHAQLSSFLGPPTATQAFPPPRGGFTDVGLHTGGKPKATTWPLLQS